MGSYWPHHADTYQDAGHSRIAPAAAMATGQRCRNHQASVAASPRSATVAGSFMNARIAGSEESVVVRNAGSTAASAPQIQAITGGNERFWSYAFDQPSMATP